MKKGLFLSVALLALATHGFSQTPWNGHWSDPIVVAIGTNPDFDIDKANGNLHIVSMQQGVGVVYTLMDSVGNILFQQPVPGSMGDLGEWHFGASVAVDRMGYPHILYRKPVGKAEDWTYNLYYIRRNASGWLPSILISSNVYRGYVVRIAVDANDRVHIVQSVSGEELPWGQATYYQILNGKIVRTQDQLTPYRVDNRFEIDATPSGNVYIVLGLPDPKGKITLYRSLDGGTTISKVGEIQSSDCTGRNGSPDVFADSAGNVHICYGTQKDLSRGGVGSIRYVRYEQNVKIRDLAATRKNDLESWNSGQGWGISSVAATEDGQYVAIAYVTQPYGALKVTLSSDKGETWSVPVSTASNCDGYDGRNSHLIRAYRNNFYLVYPANESQLRIKLQYLRDVGDFPPTASAGGPYVGNEGTPIQLDMSASTDEGQNPGIVEYALDWQMDGTHDFTTTLSKVSYTFWDDFNGRIVLRVKDRSGQYDTDTTTVTIHNVPPSVDIGNDLTANEGDTLTFSCSINDPGQDSVIIGWDFGDGQVSNQQQVKHAYRDEGNGTFCVKATVTDDDGGSGKDSLNVKVLNVAPVAEAGGPYLGSVNATVQLSGSAFDPGVEDILKYSWDLNGDGSFETSGQNVSRIFNDIGKYIVWLKVQDNDGGVGLDSATVKIAKETPVILSIPNQIIDEGGDFAPLLLDDFVLDLDNRADEMRWSFYGNQALLVTLNNRVLTVAVPDSEWSGQEILTLIVKDPSNLSDTTQVRYKVNPVNDPPRWTHVPDTTFVENDTLRIPFSYYRALVSDVDDNIEDLRFRIAENPYIKGSADFQHSMFLLYGAPHYSGTEQVCYIVTDTSGASDTDTSYVTVANKPDPPDPFNLLEPLLMDVALWPDSMLFIWQRSYDPDPGSRVRYEWEMWTQGGATSKRVGHSTVSDTSFMFYPDDQLQNGGYLWWVVAWDEIGLYQKSRNFGIVLINVSSDVEDPDEVLPAEFQLFQNYPNPFNSETKITFHLPKESSVRLVIYNQLGQKVRVLIEGKERGGVHIVPWDGKDHEGKKVPTGLYLYRLEAGSNVFIKKMMLIQ